MPPYPAPPPPSFPPIPHTAPTYPINLPPISSQFSNAAQGHYQATQDPRSNHARDCLNHGSMGLEGTLQDCLIGQMEGLGLGLTDHMKSLYTQEPGHSQSLPFNPGFGPAYQLNFSPPSTMTVPPPRPHPHLTNNDLYISNVPHDLPEAAIADALRDCLPVRILLHIPVAPDDRLKPNDYYDWMPRAGTLHFTNLHSAEKALAILIAHPYLAQAGLIVSTNPTPASPYQLPHVLPFPDPPVPARYLRPTQQLGFPLDADIKDPAVAISSQVPSLGELFDIVRPWGSLRQITVWFEDGPITEHGSPTLSWGARVLFWYEDEARRFELGFGSTGFLIKGWQIFVFAEQQPFTPTPTFSFGNPPPHSQPQPQFSGIAPSTINPRSPPNDHLNSTSNIDPEIFRRMGMPIFPTINSSQPIIPNLHYVGPPTPISSPINYDPPWASHNIFAPQTDNFQPFLSTIDPMNKVAMYDRRFSVPTGSNAVPVGMRRSISNSNFPILGKDEIKARQRTWSIHLESLDDGVLVPMGIRSNDGEFIHHGPGQHIRPAPHSGPGSGSVSGLVDYSNVFVKNLDSDICSYFLEDLFSNMGRIVSAKVMRDDEGRSRGYGFVSFYSPNEAAHAVSVLNNTRVGSQQIAVTLHEPRKLRPEKQAERLAQSTSSGGSTSRRASLAGTRPDSPVSQRKASVVMRPPPAIGPINQHIDSVDAPGNKVCNPAAVYPKISKPLDVLQEGTEFKFGVDRSGATIHPAHLSFQSPISHTAIIYAGPELRAKLLEEILKIDPDDADEVLAIMWPLLHPVERQRAATSRGFLAARYGLAKRELTRRRRTAKVPEKEVLHQYSPSPSPLPTTSPIVGSDTITLESPFELIPLENITLDYLASLPAVHIMGHLSSSDGTLILQKLGMKRPTSEEAGQLARWILAVREKPTSQAYAEISSMVAKHLQPSWGKRLAQLRIARQLVELEDIGALCKIIAYPRLLDAKARLLYQAMEA